MKSVTQVYIYEGNEKFFGEGPYRLLKHIEASGSLRGAAMQMELSYNKAFHMIKRAEQTLGVPLTEKTIGGKGGGGSQLTEAAKVFMGKYERYRDACYESNQQLFQEIFEGGKKLKIGCVFMASGLGMRFGGNKLLKKLQGETLLERMLRITEGDLFARRVVVTRSSEIAKICKDKEVEAVLHEFPNRNDTVHLGTKQMEDLDGILFCPCDQPLLRRESIEALIQSFKEAPDGIVRLAYNGEAGSPILFSKRFFKELLELPEKKGGSYVAAKHKGKVRLVSAKEAMELFDIDTREDFEQVKAYMEGE